MSNQQNIRIIFMGTPEFSLPGLRRLTEETGFDVVAVFTQPDKPVGRKQSISLPPVKKMAIANNIPVYQPEKISVEIEHIKKLQADIIVVIAYGKIIPQSILDIPRFGCINVHASLLPKYRGAACLNAPILYGDEETGVTIMRMEAGLDTGPILRQSKIKLAGNESLEMVHDKLSLLGAELLIPTIYDFINGKITPETQDESKASYIKTLKKEDGKIDWRKPAREIERLVRAFTPWPGAYALWGGKTIKIIAVENEVLDINQYQTGEVFLDNGRLAVQCGQDSILILKLQLEGKKIMSAEEFLRGHKIDFLQ